MLIHSKYLKCSGLACLPALSLAAVVASVKIVVAVYVLVAIATQAEPISYVHTYGFFLSHYKYILLRV
jgi:hypothetical protein